MFSKSSLEWLQIKSAVYFYCDSVEDLFSLNERVYSRIHEIFLKFSDDGMHPFYIVYLTVLINEVSY